MPRQSADVRAAKEAEILPFRTRSGSGFISTPLSTYRVMESETVEQATERLTFAIESFAQNYAFNEGWQEGYVTLYNKLSEELKEVEKAAPETSLTVIADLRELLEDTKKTMDEKASEQPAPQTFEKEKEVTSQFRPPPAIRSQVENIRLLSESSEMFLDANAESEMLNNLRYLSKGAANIDRVSKLASDVSNVTIGQQHALRVVRTDLRLISSNVEQIQASIPPRVTTLETQVVNLQTSLNNTVTSQLQLDAKVMEQVKKLQDKITVMESYLQSTPIPPAHLNSTHENDNYLGNLDPEQSGASHGRPEGPRPDIEYPGPRPGSTSSTKPTGIR